MTAARHVLWVLLTLASVLAQARAGERLPVADGTTRSVPEREIAALIAGLGSSGCEFQRNGSWHDAVAARDHLQRKYDYMRRRDKAFIQAPTAERFIERAASRSSMTGQAYRVRCPGRPVEPAADWFGRRLQALRAQSA